MAAAPRYFVVPASQTYGDVTSVLYASKKLEDAKGMAPRGYVVRMGDRKAGSKWYPRDEAEHPVIWERQKPAHATQGRRAHAAIDLDRANAEIAPNLGKTPAQIVRAINAIVRAADGRNVYLISTRMDREDVQRVVGARAMPGTKGRGLDVRLLGTGAWKGVLAEMGDRIEVR